MTRSTLCGRSNAIQPTSAKWDLGISPREKVLPRTTHHREAGSRPCSPSCPSHYRSVLIPDLEGIWWVFGCEVNLLPRTRGRGSGFASFPSPLPPQPPPSLLLPSPALCAQNLSRVPMVTWAASSSEALRESLALGWPASSLLNNWPGPSPPDASACQVLGEFHFANPAERPPSLIPCRWFHVAAGQRGAPSTCICFPFRRRPHGPPQSGAAPPL